MPRDKQSSGGHGAKQNGERKQSQGEEKHREDSEQYSIKPAIEHVSKD